MSPVDLRSDTLTHPTESMRQAMARAEVGDDVFDEDPTVHHLQEKAANLMGKEAALFVPSGTMGNLVSLLTHCSRGEEILLGDRSHIFLNEVGGIAALGGIHPRTVPNHKDGTLPLDWLEKGIRGGDIHYPPTRLIALENTHNYCQGSPLSLEYMEAVSSLARKYSLRIHVDGARIFNAAVSLKVPASQLVRHADSVMFCLSKGLSAPVGSLICGTQEFIGRARKIRKMVGGGMRQAGHLAAAGMVALDEQLPRLETDHLHAQKLACGLASINTLRLNVDEIKTNIIFFELHHPGMAPEQFLEALEARGVKMLITGQRTFRAVLHREITSDQVDYALRTIQTLLK